MPLVRQRISLLLPNAVYNADSHGIVETTTSQESPQTATEIDIPQSRERAALLLCRLIGSEFVVDISHGVTVGTALDEMRAESSVDSILVEIPGITASSVPFSTTPISGTGHDPTDPLVFEGTVIITEK